MDDGMLLGGPGADVLTGFDSDDVISGGGGADVLSGGGGNDIIDQTAAVLNAAAGTVMDGGSGEDRLRLDGINAYTSTYVVLRGGTGADDIAVSTGAGQYTGAVQVEGGEGADLIRLGGNVQGGEGGRGYADGGDGDDLIEVLTASNGSGIGIWGNRQFQLRGGAGDDVFKLGGTQIQYSAATAARIDGGTGFDTLVWNGSYNLTLGGQQNAALDLYAGRERGIAASNIERLDLATAGVSGLTLAITAEDVEAITAGSDFDRSTLGLGLTGTGDTLFLDTGDNTVDLTGWSLLGVSDPIAESAYRVYSSGAALLGLRVTHDFEAIPFTGTNILADLDGDGDFDDMPLEQTQACCLRCLLGDESEHTVSDAFTITAFDTNNDGVLEIFRSVYNSPVDGLGTVQLYFRDANGDYIPSEHMAAFQFRGHIEQGTPFDYDNDGDLDLFLPRYAIDNPLTPEVDYEPGSILLRNDSGTFVDVTLTTPIVSPFASDITFFTDNRQPEGVVPIDIDWDGDIDLYTSGHILLNDGEGGFIDANAHYGLAGEFDEGISINDFDNDGILDIVRMDPFAGPSLLRGTPDAGFEIVANAFRGDATYTNALGAGSWGMASIDLNSDGLLDIVINGTSDGDAKYFINAGGHFSRVDPIVDYGRGYSLANGDIDKNGTQDFSVVGGGTFLNGHLPIHGSIRVGLFGGGGEFNQPGRIVSLASLDAPGLIQLAPITIASGYHAQNDYMISTPLAGGGAYRISHSPWGSSSPGALPFEMVASAGWNIAMFAAADGTTRVEAMLDGKLARPLDGSTQMDLLSGSGDDTIALALDQLNAAAGTVIDGGGGDDLLRFDGINAHTSAYVVLRGGTGADDIAVSTGAGHYTGAVQVEGGDGDDVIRLGGGLQGGQGGLGYADGGGGDDLIEVLTASDGSGIGILGDEKFELRGGSGDDLFKLGGTQLLYSDDTVAMLDGGSGFDTLVWNGSYNLTLGGRQNAALEPLDGHEQGISTTNIERLDLATAGVSGLALTISAEDVQAMTAGSDFDRSTLGLGHAGTGDTLFLDIGDNSVDLSGWTLLGEALLGEDRYLVYGSGDTALLGVRENIGEVPTSASSIDTMSGWAGDHAGLVGGDSSQVPAEGFASLAGWPVPAPGVLGDDADVTYTTSDWLW